VGAYYFLTGLYADTDGNTAINESYGGNAYYITVPLTITFICMPVYNITVENGSFWTWVQTYAA
jgi:hypothetical protein